MGPDCFPLPGSMEIWTGRQYGDLDELLGIFTLVPCEKVICHLAQVLPLPMVTLMVGTPQTH